MSLVVSDTSPLRFQIPAGVVLIIVAVIIIYLQSVSGGFIWDDHRLITDNDIVKASDGLYRIWCSTQAIDYWPVTNTTFWIEWRLWGMNPTGYHVSNLILHVVESLLIWVALRKLSIPGAFLAALIFAVHPVNVESVAWIVQRKNLMAMLFFLLSILCYLKHLCSRHTPCAVPADAVCGLHKDFWYWLSLAAFVLAMLSKGSVAILPLILLGIVWWLRPLIRWDLLRIAPFFLVAAVLVAVNMWFQTRGTGATIRTTGFVERILGAGCVLWFYLYKAILPVNLYFVYPQWHIETGNPLWWLPLFTALAVTTVLWLYRKSWSRPFLFAWGFFCVALLPVLGFTDVYFMKFSLVADHYQHIALVGVIALASASWSKWHRKTQSAARRLATVISIAVVAILVFLSCRQSGIYCDEITLYKATLQKNPQCWMAHTNLGTLLFDKGQLLEAIEHYEQALRLNPDHVEAHNNLGNALLRTGRAQDAIAHYNQALRLKSDLPEAQYNLGNAFLATGQWQEAMEHYRQALLTAPDYAEAHNNLAAVLAQTGRHQEAIDHYKQALRFKTDYSEAYNNLGVALVETGQFQEAIKYYKQAVRLYPDYANAFFNMALAYAKLDKSTEALAAAQNALEISQTHGQTMQAKQIEEWIYSYRASLSESSNTPPASK